MNKPIKVYKASAGAGKTYTLVYEYIKYLFLAALCAEGETHPGSRKLRKNVHRSVLAVTFTNKSTAEMKERIVKALDKLSKGEEPDYIERLKKELWAKASDDKTEDTIRKVAAELLTDILQDYSSFRVSTIDGFFQQVVRSFARELNLDNQYEVELDNDTIMEMAVDNMLASLGEEGKGHLLASLTEFASEKVDDSRSWNPRKDIIELSKLVTSEAYMSQKEHFKFDPIKLRDYRERVRKEITTFEKKVEQICGQAKAVLDGVSDKEEIFAKTTLSGFDYEYKKSQKFELKSTFKKLKNDSTVSTWLKGKYKKDESYQTIIDKLYPLGCELIEMLDPEGDIWHEYQTAQVVYAHLYILGILNEIDENAMEICRARDCMIISSTTDFLNKIIENSDTPFIYEKVGVTTDHFMIDEFQDTSRLQWANFLPLLKDSVAEGHESMIVGDVKQSIYRWRNGDWKILHNGVKKEFGSAVGDETLEYNYRSAKEVIEFNNELYRELPKILDSNLEEKLGKEFGEKFSEIYKGEQKTNPKNKKTGYVKLRFIEEEEKKEDISWKEKSLDAMVEQMHMLDTHKGVAVLVRTNKEAQTIADRLKEEKIPFYSSEALCVADNEAVRLIEAILRYIIQPYESVYRANFLALYNKVCRGKCLTAEDHELLSDKGDIREWEKKVLRDEKLSEEENEQRWHEFDNMKSYPLQRMIQTTDKIFGLSETEEGYNKVYIQSLEDKVHEYSINNSTDVRSFLDYWTENGSKTYISMPEGDDAVRIITIFKSKGLEFGVVFIPFVDWSMGISKFFNIKLIDTNRHKEDGELFTDGMPVLPVNTRGAKKMLDSKFKKEITEEYVDSCLDKLNLMYVATTRAEQQLYINLKVDKPKKDNTDSSSIDPISMSALVKTVVENNKDNARSEEDHVFEYGGQTGKENRFVQPEQKEEKHSEIESRELTTDPETRPTEEEIDARAQLNYKYSEAGEIADYSARRKGLRMHKLFERIVTAEDVDKAVMSLVRDGDIREEDADKTREKAEQVMKIEGVREWFDKKWHVLNETELFINNGEEIYRPDRVVIDEKEKKAVVIDYKFGNNTTSLHKKYSNQVKRYMNAIEDMGYDVKGYLLYAAEEKMMEVE